MEPPVTREALYQWFGRRAFVPGLFYEHQPALRFELSRGGSRIDQFTQAYDRVRELARALFAGSERLVAVVHRAAPAPLTRNLDLFRALRECQIPLARPRTFWYEEVEDDDPGIFVAFPLDGDALDRVLWAAVARDLRIQPRAPARVFVADPKRGVLAHPYDDRGMDVIGPNHALLRSLFERYKGYLLDYDRARMEAFFQDG